MVLEGMDLLVIDFREEMGVQWLEEFKLTSHDIASFFVEIQGLFNFLDEELFGIHHLLHFPQLLH